MCVGGACGLGKVRRLHLAGVGAESEQGGGGHGFAVESEGLRRGTVRTPGGGERDRSARRRPRQGAGGGSPVWSPASSRPLTIPSKAPEISVLSACGNVVWRKVAPRPRAPAPPPHGAPPTTTSPAPASFPSPPSARAPRRPPPRTRRPAACPAEQTWSSLRALWKETWGNWDWRQHPILGSGAQELPGRLDPPGQEK